MTKAHGELMVICTMRTVVYRARIFRPFKEPSPAWWAGTTMRQATYAGEIDSSESIPGLHKCLQIQAQYLMCVMFDSAVCLFSIFLSACQSQIVCINSVCASMWALGSNSNNKNLLNRVRDQWREV
jgi:hypothetical protein